MKNWDDLTGEQIAQLLGEEMRVTIEKEREAYKTAEEFTLRYLIPMGEAGSDARDSAEKFITQLEQHKPQHPTPDTLQVEVVFERGDKTVIFTPEPGFQNQFEITRAELPAIKVRLLVVPRGVAFQTNEGDWLALGVELPQELQAGLNARNARHGWEAPPELLERLAPQPSPESNFEPDELLAMLPNGKAERDLERSVMAHPQGWQLNSNLAKYVCDGREGHVTEFQPEEVTSEFELALGDAPQRALDSLDRRFKELRGATVADVIDILFHHWNSYKDPKTNSTFITAAKLCEYRGKVADGENLDLHWRALRDAFSFTLRDTKSDLNAKLFFSESKGEIKDGPGARYAYSPGFMLQYALANNPLYFAPFLRKVWALDPVRNNEAKRLARYLRGDWRMNTEKYLESGNGKARAARWRKWSDILADATIEVETHLQSKDPSRLIKALNRAVETLYDMEVIAEGGFDIYHPDDRKRAENLPRRGALTEWLSLRVCMAPSAKLREALMETDTKRRARREREAKAMATERAKKRLRTPKNKL